jgi:hypothetical protein
MPTNTCIPYFDEADNLTATATAAVTGKTCVDISADQQADGTFSAAPCPAGAKPFGVAEYDAAVGQWFGVVREGVVPVTAGGPLAAGQLVQVGANGLVIVWDGTVASQRLGKCLTSAIAGADAMIDLDI